MGYDRLAAWEIAKPAAGPRLPIWMSYMESALNGVPRAVYTIPENMVAVHQR